MSTKSSGIGNCVDYKRVTGACTLSALLLFGQTAPLLANPTGGAVVAGAATIGAAGKTLTINQSTNNAIINWQTFSIANGETTKFIVPNSSSATLNYVLSGNPSAIYGTLSSNGHLFLINPSGILVGASGRIDTAGFLGSTLNPNVGGTGTLVFSGNSTAGIVNQGSINASQGNVYLIANQVSNQGSITAPQGDVGLAAGSNVLLEQEGDQHLFVQSNPIGTQRAFGVSNAGTISAATAELRAAGGNAYALAINNTGSIAATGYKKINGQVYLTADTGIISNSGSIRATGRTHGGTIHIASQTGTIKNSGLIDVSATGTSGVGGSVSLVSMGGLVANTGEIDAKGGTGGVGGDVDVSGEFVDISNGVVNTLAANGETGMFTIDPATWTVAASGGDETGAQVSTDLASSNITLEGDNTVTIEDIIKWSSTNTLTITTTAPGATIEINSEISGVNGGLVLNATPLSGFITTSNSGSIDVASFNLENGAFTQVVGQNGLTSLPTFIASSDFELQSNTTFERFAGGDGSAGNPYQITDVYGLQGVASPSGALLGSAFVLNNNIGASGTAGWNGDAGFTPIGNGTTAFTGTFNGQGFTINDLTVDLPSSDFAALFGETAAGSVVENVNLTADAITGENAAGIAAENFGTIEGSSATGTVTGASTSVDVGGLVAQNFGMIEASSSGGSVQGGANSGADGGLVGANDGTIASSYSTAAVSGSNDVGGLAGYNFTSSTIENSYSTGAVNGTANVGGLVGFNSGTVESSYSTSAISGTGAVGGLIGNNAFGGSVTASYWATDAGGSNGSLSTTGINDGSTDTFTSGETLANLDNESTFQPAGSGTGEWDFGTTWTTNGNTTTPQLIENVTGTAYSNSGTSVAPNAVITIIMNGAVTGTTTANSNGVFTLSLSPTELGDGLVLAVGTDSGDTYLQASGLATTYFGADIWGSTLRVNANTASNTALGTAIGSLSGNTIAYAVNGSNLTTNAGINFNVVSGTYNIDGNITANGTFTVGSGATLTGGVSAVLQGTSISDFGGLNSTAALTMQSTAGEILLEGVGSAGAPATVNGLTLNSAGAVYIQGSYINLPSGNFSATGTGYTSLSDSNGQPNGITIYDSSIVLSGGNLTLNGTAGLLESGDALQSGIGVSIVTDGVAPTQLSTTGSGSITINGLVNQEQTVNNSATGVLAYDSDPSAGGITLSVQNGLLAITGTVSGITSNGSGANAATISGVSIEAGSLVEATGSGSVLITGNTSTATTALNGGNFSFIDGIEISGLAQVNTGNLTITGTAGTLDTSSSTINSDTEGSNGLPLSVGVIFDMGDGTGGTNNLVSGSGSVVNITGTGGSVVTTGAFTGNSIGVSFSSGSQADLGVGGGDQDGITLGSTVSVTGTGGTVNAGNGDNIGDTSSTGVHIGGSLTVEAESSLSVTGTGGMINASNATGGSDQHRATSQGVRIAGNAVVGALGNSALHFIGTGGTVTASSGANVGSVGVNIGDGGNSDGDSTVNLSVQYGVLTINGTAGSSPNFGDGVAIHGTNGNQVEIQGTPGQESFDGTQIFITGTGGAGYTGTGTISGTILPNTGVVIADNVAITTPAGVSITGNNGANSNGVSLINLTGDTALDASETPVSPTINAGDISIVANTGNVLVDAGLQASSQITITSPGSISILNTGGMGSFTTDNLTITAGGAIYIDNAISGVGTMNITNSNSNVTLGPDAQITDSGTTDDAPNVLTISAGTSSANGGFFINGSTLAGTAVTATDGAVYYILSLNPSGDQYNGLTPESGNVVFDFPSNPLPSGGGEVYFGGSTPNTPPVNLIDMASMDDGSGSNLVPVSTVPQNGALGNGSTGDQGAAPGTGNSNQGGDNTGGLANSSGNGGLIGPGDSGVLGNGTLGNFQNPAVYSAFGTALGAEVYTDLSSALGQEDGGWYPDDAQPGNNGGGNNAMNVGPGGVVVMQNGQVQNVAPGDVPGPLKNAMGNGTFNNMPGH